MKVHTVRGDITHSSFSTLIVADSKWFESTIPYWKAAFDSDYQVIKIDLSNIDIMPVSTWAKTVTILGKVLREKKPTECQFDLVGIPRGYLTAKEFKRRQAANQKDSYEYQYSEKIFRLGGFLNSLGTISILSSEGSTNLSFPYIGAEGVEVFHFYTGGTKTDKVIMPFQKIASAADCKNFLNSGRIRAWRTSMEDTYVDSPLLKYEELWRVFCYELASNVVEHSESIGVLSARILKPLDSNNKLAPWIRLSYSKEFCDLISKENDKFLELCISDAGLGIAGTLTATYKEIADIDQPFTTSDILAFAFDEFGTSKKGNESWITKRHALGRILHIVTKYGGFLCLSSGNAEIVFQSAGTSFVRVKGNLGFKPTCERELDHEIIGTHIQLILPLKTIEANGSKRESVLFASLPCDYAIDKLHPVGHLVPLQEKLGSVEKYVGTKELIEFRKLCEKEIARLSQSHSSNEPIVFDFDGLGWTAAKFETFLHYFQNIIQFRPVLLLNINIKLAQEVVRNEAEEYYKDTNEKDGSAKYLAAYRSIHLTLLGEDSNGDKYIFGLPNREYEAPLLGLIKKPMTRSKIAEKYNLDEGILSLILNNINPMFYSDARGVWHSVWSEEVLSIQTKRTISKNFAEIALKCDAWRGNKSVLIKTLNIPVNNQASEDQVFHLPWRNVWVESFFQASRLLTRQRYSDEIAQRLIFRLEVGLKMKQMCIEDIGVLACATAPANLLAASLYRWWPCKEKPAVADLGPYVLLKPYDSLPSISVSGSVLIVQDIIEYLDVSRKLIKLLNRQGRHVAGLLSIIKFVKETDENTKGFEVNDIDKWETYKRNNELNVYGHSMFDIPRPKVIEKPSDDQLDNMYWVEPRTLRPFRYRYLSGFKKPGVKQSKRILPTFFNIDEDIFCAGHYVYGTRHYSVSIDINKAINGSIGDQVVHWLERICLGHTRKKASWENDIGYKQIGDVSSVLMPLHSQIHYLWPKLSDCLAANSRRIPMWLLDATLLLGHGAAYRLPLPFDQQIVERFETMANNMVQGKIQTQGLRILVLDDSVVSATTAETIISEIDRVVSKARERLRKSYGVVVDSIIPIEWIKYFTIFSQMTLAKFQHWKSISTVGSDPGIPFSYEAFAWISGLPNYQENDCPHCLSLRRVNRLKSRAIESNALDLLNWANSRIGVIDFSANAPRLKGIGGTTSLYPKAVDSPGFHDFNPTLLPRKIGILHGKKNHRDGVEFEFHNVDKAILRFYELMYRSYPIREILMSLKHESFWALEEDVSEVRDGYERFRWIIYEWCIHNWARVEADCAQEAFISCVRDEVACNSDLIGGLMEYISTIKDCRCIKFFITELIAKIASAESNYKHDTTVNEEKDIGKIILPLVNGLQIFMLSIPTNELLDYRILPDDVLLSERIKRSSKRKRGQISLLRNLGLQIERNTTRADPRWSLLVLDETLFRGRDPDKPTENSHYLLPRLIDLVQDPDERKLVIRLLASSLNLFKNALEDLLPYMSESDMELGTINDNCTSILKSVVGEKIIASGDLTSLSDLLSLTGAFCSEISKSFHIDPKKLISEVRDHLEKLTIDGTNLKEKLNLDSEISPEIEDVVILAPHSRVLSVITNWGLDPIRDSSDTTHSTKIKFNRSTQEQGSERVTISIYTDFNDNKTTNKKIKKGPKYEVEIMSLEKFGVTFPAGWDIPEKGEEVYKTVYRFDLPISFRKKK